MGAALEHHRAGRLTEAERAYEAVLDAEPTNVDALNLLGVIKGQKGDLAAAERLIGAALRRAPNAPLVILNYGNVLSFTPPLTISEAQLTMTVKALNQVLASA